MLNVKSIITAKFLSCSYPELPYLKLPLSPVLSFVSDVGPSGGSFPL